MQRFCSRELGEKLLVAPLFAMCCASGQGSGFSDTSARARTPAPRYPDASTLGVTACNVGMIQEDAFTKTQDSKVAELAGHVERWLEEGPAMVGLHEIHPNSVTKLQLKLKVDVDIEHRTASRGAPLSGLLVLT